MSEKNALVPISTWIPDDYVPPDITEEQKTEVLKRVKSLFRNVARSYIQICEDLYFIRKGKYYFKAGYPSFKKYVEKELHLDLRQAQYYISTYTTLVFQYHISREYVQQIGITKARALVSVITEEEKDLMVKDAIDCSVKEFNDKYKPKVVPEERLLNIDATPEKVRNRKINNYNLPSKEYSSTIAFRVFEDQKLVIDNAIDVAADSSASSCRAHNLSLVCSSYLATSMLEQETGRDIVPLHLIIATLEKSYKCKIIVEELNRI